jgi:hypothetical protein
VNVAGKGDGKKRSRTKNEDTKWSMMEILFYTKYEDPAILEEGVRQGKT